VINCNMSNKTSLISLRFFTLKIIIETRFQVKQVPKGKLFGHFLTGWRHFFEIFFWMGRPAELKTLFLLGFLHI